MPTGKVSFKKWQKLAVRAQLAPLQRRIAGKITLITLAVLGLTLITALVVFVTIGIVMSRQPMGLAFATCFCWSVAAHSLLPAPTEETVEIEHPSARDYEKEMARINKRYQLTAANFPAAA